MTLSATYARPVKFSFLQSCWVSSITGARKSANAEQNLARLDDLAFAASILAIDADTAKEYGRVKNELRAKGTPIPENDLWIAALARQHAFVLVSRDEHLTLQCSTGYRPDNMVRLQQELL